MPEWTEEDESILRDLVQQGKTDEEIAAIIGRSPEAVAVKRHRIGLSAAQGFKVTESTTTMPMAAEIRPAEDLIEPEDALKIILGALERLRQPDVGSAEVRKIRLMITGFKAYVSLWTVYEDVEQVKKRITALEAMLKEMNLQKSGAEAPSTSFKISKNQQSGNP